METHISLVNIRSYDTTAEFDPIKFAAADNISLFLREPDKETEI